MQSPCPRRLRPRHEHPVFLGNAERAVGHVRPEHRKQRFPRQLPKLAHARERTDIVRHVLRVGHLERVVIVIAPYVRKEGGKLRFPVLQGELVIRVVFDAILFKKAAKVFHHAVFAVGSAVKRPVVSEHAPDLRQRFAPVRNVIQHHIGDHNVKRGVRVRNALDIHRPVRDAFLVFQRLFRLGKHALGKIGKNQPTAPADQLVLSRPHIARAAAELQHRHAVFDPVMRYDPAAEALPVRRIPAVQRDAYA